MLDKISFKKPLVIGTGGGNDIVSASLIIAELQNKNIFGDLAGVCSPGAIHFYNGQPERSVNEVSADAQRFLESKQRKQLSFIDGYVPSALKNNGINAGVYNLSGRFGTEALIEGLEKLIVERGYDGVIAVDVGGDILARGKKDPTILSPLMDFTTLYAVSKLSVPSVLVEFGLQTDGELRPEGCNEIFSQLAKDGFLLAEEKFRKQDPAFRKVEAIYNQIKEIRHGHTMVMTNQTLEAERDIQTEYRFHVQVLDKKVTHWFPLTLEAKYFGKVFTIDLKPLVETRPHAFSYRNNLELYLKTKLVANTKTEMDLLYFHDDRQIVWLGMGCPQITGDERRNLINYGLENLSLHADSAILWKEDAENLRLKKHSATVEDFTITADEPEKVSQLTKFVEGVLS